MRSKALVVALVIPLLAIGVEGQRGRPLFSEDTGARSRISAAAAVDDVVRQRAARINWNYFLLSGGDATTVAPILELNLFDDVFLVATLDRAEELSGMLIWSGRVTAPGASEATFVLKNGVMTGRIVASTGTFEVRSTGGDSYVINQLRVSAAAPPPVPGFVAPPRTRGDRHGVAPEALTTPVDWLTLVNTHRAEAGLAAVKENAVYSAGDLKHAQYIVKTNTLVHAEDPASPFYTKDGDTAGQSSDVAAHTNIAAPDQFAVDAWMQGPFHAIGIIDPKLLETGFGSFREAAVGFQMGAALDVIRGRRQSVPPGVKFPIAWPADGKVISAPNPDLCPPGTACFWGENPDPLSSCPGYLAPAGLPLILQLGGGTVKPKVTSHSLTSNGVALEHCIFDETNYKNLTPSLQDLGRNILNSRSAIVLIPRLPLPVGQSYTVSITTNGTARKWTFTIQPAPTTFPTQ